MEKETVHATSLQSSNSGVCGTIQLGKLLDPLTLNLYEGSPSISG